MKTAVICFVVLALAVPLAVSYPQSEGREQQIEEPSTPPGAAQDEDDFQLETMLRMIQQTPDEEGGGDDEAGEQQVGEDDNQPIIQQTKCATHLYVMAFTSGARYAGSDDHPYLLVDLFNHEEGAARFPDNPGNDMLENKGDLWIFSLRSALKLRKSCITKADINKIVVHNGGNDGWKIASIITILRAGRYYSVMTADIGLYHFVDGDLNVTPSSHQITLTKAP
jgi:hypothetical protein